MSLNRRFPVTRRALFASLLGLCGCDAGPDGGAGHDADPRTPSDARIGDTSPVDASAADAGLPPGAPCDETEPCARGACLNGLCSPICVGDEDCPTDFRCVARGGGTFCTPKCAAVDDCGSGLICVPTAPREGYCVAPGGGGGGAPCDVADDCASWSCSGGVCLATCGAESDCMPTQTCLPLQIGGVCVESGPGEVEDTCERATDCRSGVCRGGGCTVTCNASAAASTCPEDRACVAYVGLSLCERPCQGPDDCGGDGVCLSSAEGVYCQTRGERPTGASCQSHAECGSGHCGEGVCAATCEAGCPAAQACVRDVSGAACRPAGGQDIGARCLTGAECETGFCAAGRCGRDCAEIPECPDGLACVQFDEGRFCFPRCASGADCEAVAYCAPTLSETPVCFWRGALADGSVCQRDFECVSGLCAGERCLAACPTGDCGGGQQCRDFRRVAYCTPLPAPVGAECYANAECQAGLTCAAGRCLPPCDAGCPTGAGCPAGVAMCQPTCATDLDCLAAFDCVVDAEGEGHCGSPSD